MISNDKVRKKINDILYDRESELDSIMGLIDEVRQEGYDEGHSDGYNKGYDEGYDAGGGNDVRTDL